jgi:ABC-type uncharacterized transport system substrate-binding protein
MRRREFIRFLGGAAAAWPLIAPPAAFAQTSKVYCLGALTAGPPLATASGPGAILINTLAQRGYTLGKNFAYEARGAGGKMRLPQLMQELKAAKVDAVVTVSYPAAVAAKASGVATVIATGSGDPVATGLVESLARPGGNVTGIADEASALSTKRLSLLKTLLPQLRRVAMLRNKDDLGMSLRYQAWAKAAQEIGVAVQALGVREPDDFNDAFVAMDHEPPDAILAAALVDSVFKGVRPSDLPVEQPTRYLFVFNQKTAKAMNLSVPNTLVALADEVIE